MELFHNNVNLFFFDTIKNNCKAGFLPPPHRPPKKRLLRSKFNYTLRNRVILFSSSRSELGGYLILDEEIVAEKHDNHGYVTDSDM